MSIQKNKKTDSKHAPEEHQESVSAYITLRDVLRICAFWSRNNADIGTILNMDHPERNIQIVKKSEKAILEIKFTDDQQEEKIILFEIKIYE